MNPKFFYVYIITNKITNEQYVGSKICYKDDPLNDGYWGSSRYLSEDIKKHGKHNFEKRIITTEYTNKNSMLDGETFYIKKYDTLYPNGYNRFLPNRKNGFHAFGNVGYWKNKKVPKEIVEKRANSNRGKIQTEQTKQKISNSLKGKKFTKERRDKIRNALKGKSELAKNFGPPRYGKDHPNFVDITPYTDEIIHLHTKELLTATVIGRKLKLDGIKVKLLLQEHKVFNTWPELIKLRKNESKIYK